MRLGSFNLVLALIGATSGGCAITDDDAEGSQAAEVGAAMTNVSAFVLTVSSEENDVVVSSPGHVDTCPGVGTCNFAYIGGTSLTIKTAKNNVIDCALFSHWDGACAGQSATCNLVINSNLSTSAIFQFGIPGCTPK